MTHTEASAAVTDALAKIEALGPAELRMIMSDFAAKANADQLRYRKVAEEEEREDKPIALRSDLYARLAVYASEVRAEKMGVRLPPKPKLTVVEE